MKHIEYINKQAKKEFESLPSAIQDQFTTDLLAVCENKRPFSNIKTLKESVGVGAIELIENGSPAYRSIYVAKYHNTVYVLHSFTKTTNGVDKKAMKTAKTRYKLIKSL